jgi:hypothetical protein
MFEIWEECLKSLERLMRCAFFSTVQANGWSRNLVILNMKGKVVPVRAMKVYCGNGSIVPHILNFCMEPSGWLHALTGIPSGKCPKHLLNSSLGGLQSQSEHDGEDKVSSAGN